MGQKHGEQLGTFHITTNAKGNVPWCTLPDVPAILIDNLIMTRNVLKGQVYASCILPDHMHMIVSPGEKGLSEFIQSFKKNSSRDARKILQRRSGDSVIAADMNVCSGWQKGFHDERIRDGKQCGSALNYVQRNALHHGLVKDVMDWPWTSLHFERFLDEMEMWLW